METECQDDQDRDMEEETVVSSDDNDNDDDDDDSGDYDDMVIPTNDESELNEDPDWATQEECIETGQYSSDDDDEESDQESQRKGSRNKVRYTINILYCMCVYLLIHPCPPMVPVMVPMAIHPYTAKSIKIVPDKAECEKYDGNFYI